MPQAPVFQLARPGIPGVREVLRAHFPARSHAYPLHTHAAWTLLVIDEGSVVYRLEKSEWVAPMAAVTLLPPDVPHDGEAAGDAGFRKRVVYLEPDVLSGVCLDRVLAMPLEDDAPLLREVTDLHRALLNCANGVDTLDAEERLAVVAQHLVARWGDGGSAREHWEARSNRDASRATRLRVMLDDRTVEGLTLAEASRELDCTAAALVRAFQREVGMSPHRYLVGRRLEIARRKLIDGASVADAAVDAGFFDQAHLTRHFRRLLGVTPGRFARAVAA
jgi:AraC-like DNA-binding protein